MDAGKQSVIENVRKASELVILLDHVAKVASGTGELAEQLATARGLAEGQLLAELRGYTETAVRPSPALPASARG